MADTPAPRRIAMWSGPRNVSTALSRAFGARGDCAVSDEPLYAFYLARTGLDHPLRAEVLASQPTAWEEVAATLTGPVPGGRPLWFQKHMAHHLLPEVGRGWLDALEHALLVRDPAEVVASYHARRGEVRPEDLGYTEQLELFEQVADRTGRPPPVVDGRRLQAEPERVLRALCAALGLAWTPAMLSWPQGRRASDGVWAPAWYAAVEASTGFAPPRHAPLPVPPEAAWVVEACRPAWERLRGFVL